MKKEDRITFRLGKELIEDLKLVGDLEGESISFIVRTILQDYINYYMWKNTNESRAIENESRAIENEYFENIGTKNNSNE